MTIRATTVQCGENGCREAVTAAMSNQILEARKAGWTYRNVPAAETAREKIIAICPTHRVAGDW